MLLILLLFLTSTIHKSSHLAIKFNHLTSQLINLCHSFSLVIQSNPIIHRMMKDSYLADNASKFYDFPVDVGEL